MCRVAKLEAGASGSPALPEASLLFIHVNHVPDSATASLSLALPEASLLFVHVNHVPNSATASMHPGDLELMNL